MANALPERSSQIENTVSIPVEKRRALGDVFDRWRLNCGWNPWDDQTQAAATASFVATLDREGVPYTAYNELYERAIALRVTALQNGKNLPAFGAELLLAAWNGEYGLRSELRQREIDAGRTLEANAAAACQTCYGTGLRTEIIDGYSVARKCDHNDI